MPESTNVAFGINSDDSQTDLVTLMFNQLSAKKHYTGSFDYKKKLDHELPLADWDILRKNSSYYKDVKGNNVYEYILAQRGEVTLLVSRSFFDDDADATNVNLQVATDNEKLVEVTLQELVGDSIYEEKPSENPNEVKIGFWSMTGMGPHLRRRRMLAETWDDVSRNYSASVETGLKKLMSLEKDKITGKMILLHGAPGTGKTSSLRTLALSWKQWCDLEVVVDPEQMFNNSDYLLSVLSETRDNDRWTMLLLEDCDELISKDAKRVSGQALSRLLNATDGFLSHGHNLLIGITTNEPLEKLHPAVLRSGRCLAKLEVPALTQAEAIKWLNDEELSRQVKGPMTLADLFALKNEYGVIEDDGPAVTAVGQYL